MKTKLTLPPAVREWYTQMGKLGGKSKSPAKLAAIAKNAKKGGWPKGRPRRVLAAVDQRAGSTRPPGPVSNPETTPGPTDPPLQ